MNTPVDPPAVAPPSSPSTSTPPPSACTICLQNILPRGHHRLAGLPCGHLYGKSCILAWLGSIGASGCPQCGAACQDSDVRPLYAANPVPSDDTTDDLTLSVEQIGTVLATLENAFMAVHSARDRQKVLMDEVERLVKDAGGVLIHASTPGVSFELQPHTPYLFIYPDGWGDVSYLMCDNSDVVARFKIACTKIRILLTAWRADKKEVTREQSVYDEQLSIVRTILQQ